ncbi:MULTISPECIES: hypothetical protein [unclassified Oceanobacter]|uniref:hypothetical protein n=1 Tax=unclassified Oceanobacter TaxID=2620260 RepID=UPI0026E210D8|nr:MULTISPECIES: hypothetical protein [unclassified Oceanobacter]MDO6680876.1 hypothetical protein [Oceanobacter sp. 5_MG-2023]MDP2504643.1 hypothetical protein [Oceanobacter sp. 3_MG-2023]MDP2546904.1 hypothetical protein [Oceanobacter sp. 4_MG-2023]
MRTITTQEFFEEYRPIRNPHNEQAGLDGCLMGRSGLEYARVLEIMQESPENVWTYADSGSETPVLSSGFTSLKSLGYVITREPADVFIEVVG